MSTFFLSPSSVRSMFRRHGVCSSTVTAAYLKSTDYSQRQLSRSYTSYFQVNTLSFGKSKGTRIGHKTTIDFPRNRYIVSRIHSLIDKRFGITISNKQNIHQQTSACNMASHSTDVTDSCEENTDLMENKKSIVKVAMCQFHVTGDKAVNHETAADYIDKASSSVDLIVLPEIWNSPYATAAFPEYAEIVPDVGYCSTIDPDESPSSALLQKKAIEHQVYIVGGSIPEVVLSETKNSIIYNTCCVYDPKGTIVAKHRKVHLFDIDVPGGITFRESDTLTAGNSPTVFTMKDWNVTVGVGICYDIRFAEYAMLLTQHHNCKMLIYPGAFNMVTGPAHWELLQRARANDNQCFVVTASPARTTVNDNEDKAKTQTTAIKKYPHYTAWGHSTVVGPWGDILATHDESAAIVRAELDLTKVDSIRQSIPITYQKRNDMYQLIPNSKQ